MEKGSWNLKFIAKEKTVSTQIFNLSDNNNSSETFETKKTEIKNNRKRIKEEYKEQIEKEKKEVLKDITKSDKKTGAWFVKLLSKVLDTHAKKVNAEYFQSRYPTSPKDVIAKKIIQYYQNYNMAIGVVIGGAGGIGEIYCAIISSFPEIALVAYNQLKLIYELSVVYGDPINLDDPEEALSVLLIAFDIKISEILKKGAKWGVDKGGKLIVERASKRVVLRKIQSQILQTVGKKLTQKSIKNIILKSPPIIGAIFGAIACGVTDYYTTKKVATKTLYRYRTGKLAVEYFIANDRIYENIGRHWITRRRKKDEYIQCSQVLSKGCWIIANADGKVDSNKTQLIDFIYSTKPLEEEFISEMKNRIQITTDEFLSDFNRIKYRNKKREMKIKETIFYAMKLIAVSDNKISSEEVSILEKVAPFLDITSDALSADLKNLKDSLFKL